MTAAAFEGIMENPLFVQIEEIRKRMKCSKGFLCAESGLKKLCRAKDVGLKRHLLCLENAPASCDFSLFLDRKYYCACPLRVYIIKNLQKDYLGEARAV